MIPWKYFFLAVCLELSLEDSLLQWRCYVPMKKQTLDQRKFLVNSSECVSMKFLCNAAVVGVNT